MIEILPVPEGGGEVLIDRQSVFLGTLEEAIVFVIGFVQFRPLPIDGTALEPGNIRVSISPLGRPSEGRVVTFSNAASLYLRALSCMAQPLPELFEGSLVWGDGSGDIWKPVLGEGSPLTQAAWDIASRRLGDPVAVPDIPPECCSNCLSRFVYREYNSPLRRCITCMYTEVKT